MKKNYFIYSTEYHMKMRCFFVCIRILYHVKVVTFFLPFLHIVSTIGTSIKQRQIERSAIKIYSSTNICVSMHITISPLCECLVDRFYVWKHYSWRDGYYISTHCGWCIYDDEQE